jgi:hypothetical protein
MIPSYQQQSHIGNYHVQGRIIMIPSYQEQSHIGNALRLVFTLYTVYLLSHLPTGLMGNFFIISTITSVVYVENSLNMECTTSLLNPYIFCTYGHFPFSLNTLLCVQLSEQHYFIQKLTLSF